MKIEDDPVVEPQPFRAAQMECSDKPCKTCLFGGEEPVRLTPEYSVEVYGNVSTGMTSLTCHGANNTKLCRGARNLQIKTFYAMGLLEEPTNEAFEAQLKAADAHQFPES